MYVCMCVPIFFYTTVSSIKRGYKDTSLLSFFNMLGVSFSSIPMTDDEKSIYLHAKKAMDNKNGGNIYSYHFFDNSILDRYYLR